MTETELEYQFCFNCNDRKQCYTKPKDCTRIQEEIGLQEMTNEEWFTSLSTEEKAMAIVLCCPYEIDWFGEDFEKRMEQRMKNLSQSAQGYGLGIQKIKVWLKQPHTFE